MRQNRTRKLSDKNTKTIINELSVLLDYDYANIQAHWIPAQRWSMKWGLRAVWTKDMFECLPKNPALPCC